jgi:hypothetical protein
VRARALIRFPIIRGSSVRREASLAGRQQGSDGGIVAVLKAGELLVRLVARNPNESAESLAAAFTEELGANADRRRGLDDVVLSMLLNPKVVAAGIKDFRDKLRRRRDAAGEPGSRC